MQQKKDTGHGFSVYEPPIVAEIDDTFFTGGHGALGDGQLSIDQHHAEHPR